MPSFDPVWAWRPTQASLEQMLLSFAFNTAILAFTINIAASLFGPLEQTLRQVTKRGRTSAGSPLARRNSKVVDLVAKQQRIDWL